LPAPAIRQSGCEDPALAEVAAALRDTGHWGWIVDQDWRLVYVTDELRLTFGAGLELASFAIGEHFYGTEAMRASEEWRFGSNTPELSRISFSGSDVAHAKRAREKGWGVLGSRLAGD